MTKLVTVPIRCGDKWHCVDIDTDYEVHVRNHSQEDIDAELTIKDLCPEYKMVECVKFSEITSATAAILEDPDVRVGWTASDTTFMSSIIFNDESVANNIRVLYFAIMLKRIMDRVDLSWHVKTRRGLSIKKYQNEVIEYLNKIILSNGMGIPEKLVHISMSDNIESVDSRINFEYFELVRYLNGGVDWRFDQLSKGNLGSLAGIKTGAFKLYRGLPIMPPGDIRVWSDKIISEILNKEAKRLGCGI
jgi:hypothetical protein